MIPFQRGEGNSNFQRTSRRKKGTFRGKRGTSRGKKGTPAVCVCVWGGGGGGGGGTNISRFVTY